MHQLRQIAACSLCPRSKALLLSMCHASGQSMEQSLTYLVSRQEQQTLLG